jgi:type II secretory pathway predicted ATPase ExeA
MNKTSFHFRDFLRAKQNVLQALIDQDESYVLLTGDTGTGKTALLRELRNEVDRARFRVLYFSEARKLGPAGLVKVISESLRVRTSMSHSLGLDRLIRTLSEESHTVMLWLDEAHDLKEDTLAQVRALAESDLDGGRRIKVLLIGLPKLRAELQAHPYLWRRIVVREEITGLLLDELQGFLDHHFPAGQSKRLCEQGLSMLFERAKGVPGLVLPMYRTILARSNANKGKIDPIQVGDALDRWNL